MNTTTSENRKLNFFTWISGDTDQLEVADFDY